VTGPHGAHRKRDGYGDRRDHRGHWAPDRPPARPARGGVGDGMLMAAVVALLAVCGLFWLATAIGGLLSHGSWPDITLAQAGAGIRRALEDPSRPMTGWPPAVAGQLPGRDLFYAVLATLSVLLAVVVGLGFRFHLRRLRRRYGPRAAGQEAGQAAEAPPASSQAESPGDGAPGPH
jgi:hypothetical protein